MGSSFLSIPVPDKEGLFSYRISLKVLAVAYFILASLTILTLALNLADNSREYFTFLSIFISSSQALLFTFTLISLVNPKFVRMKKLVRYIIPTIFFTFLYITSYLYYGDPGITSLESIVNQLDNPTIWVRVLFLLYYLFQLIYYTWIFLRVVKRYDQEILNYFSEVYQLKMNWVRIAYFSALCIGIIALVTKFIPVRYDWIVTLSFAFFYFVFALEYIKYNKVFSLIEPAISIPLIDAPLNNIKIRQKRDWPQNKQEILSNRYYCEPGITIEDLAQKLHLGRTTLSNTINREEEVNFNTWINKLRIEEAKKILITNPEYSLASVSEMVGFTEQSNFSRQFKLIVGQSPLFWRNHSV